jgi:hypothetical protein
MISFRSTDFRDRREINEFEDEYAILMKSDRNDNEERLDSQMNLDESEDEKSVDK